jgi:hypothetical protein
MSIGLHNWAHQFRSVGLATRVPMGTSGAVAPAPISHGQLRWYLFARADTKVQMTRRRRRLHGQPQCPHSSAMDTDLSRLIDTLSGPVWTTMPYGTGGFVNAS